MNHYFLSKTGWDFFDLSKAYGLGIIMHALSGDAVVSDMGGFYLIKTKKEPEIENTDNILRFLGNEEAFDRTLLTIGAALREKKKKEVQEFLKNSQNVQKIVDDAKELNCTMVMGNGKETLYQPMDLAATKGFRDNILLKRYSEGDPVKISMDDFSLSLLGHLNASIRKKSNLGSVFVIPTPLETRILHLVDEINLKINKSVKSLHRAGWLPTVAQIAINLTLEEIRIQKGNKFSPKFGSLVFGVMTKRTRNQPKPLSTGIFSIDLLNDLAETNKGVYILNKWKEIFEMTAFRKGYEDLPASLTEYISNPNLLNYERYISLHLRNDINKDRWKFGSYENEGLMEVMKHVEI